MIQLLELAERSKLDIKMKLSFSPNSKQEPVLASMTWTEKDGFKLIENQLNVNDADTVAVANFTNAINETGWSYLEVTTYPQFPDKVQVGGSIFEFH